MKKLLYEEILKERLTAADALSKDRHPIAVMLHNVRSVYNVGSIFRTSDSALVREIVLTGYTPHPPREDLHKTALDAENSVPWQYISDPREAISYLRQKGYGIYALELTNRKRLYTSITKNNLPLCIILGNELTGLDDEILELCDDAIELPMHGVKHSLNVSVAAGICIYELLRVYTL